MAIPRVLSAETKAINPRKMLIRVNYEITVRAYRMETMMIPSGVLEPGLVEEKQEEAEGYFAVAIPEKRFQFQDQLDLSGSQPAMAEILLVQPDVSCGDAKLIGGKLVFKGKSSCEPCTAVWTMRSWRRSLCCPTHRLWMRLRRRRRQNFKWRLCC